MIQERLSFMKNLNIFIMVALLLLIANACSVDTSNSYLNETQKSDVEIDDEAVLPETIFDNTYQEQEGVGIIYLAGGCFWGLEKLMQSIPGVESATSGYANGQPGIVPSYTLITRSETGYRETVRVEYRMDEVSLDTILFAFFRVIDPTIENRQGNDVGSQYQSGIYFRDETSKAIVERIADIERSRYEKFAVEIEPLERFYEAEEYHQDYLEKNPGGYTHITQEEYQSISNMIVDPADYPRPSEETIKSILNEVQYTITQKAGTEPPFQNEFWDNHERGIYVDVVTGEPIFSSGDKFDSGTGWPSFSAVIDIQTLVLLRDNSLGMQRTEVRSRTGNSHLGHVFYNDPVSPSGIRYCINSAALRFIPFDEMESEGYGYLLNYFE